MPGATERRLTSWTEIADHLGRDVRTAMRWEKERRLPVHRDKGDGRSVYAFSNELDDWLLCPRPAPFPPATISSRPLPFRKPFLIAGSVLLLLLSLAVTVPRWPRLRAGQSRRPLETVRSGYPVPSPVSVAAADFNRKGHLDLVVAGGDFTLRIFPGNDSGAFSAPIKVQLPLDAKPFRVYVADLNGDGLPDLVIISKYQAPHPAEVFLNRGDFHFEHAAYVGTHPAKIAFGDFNGDGITDLAVGEYSDNSISLYLGDGRGQFRQSAHVAVGNAGGLGLVAIDLNRDGKLDLANAEYRMASGKSVGILLGDGHGGLVAAGSYPVGLGPLDMATGDFNGDGIPDLVTVELHDGASVLLGKGDGTFLRARHYDTGRGSGSVAVADLDGDGILDLVVLNEHSNDVSVLYGKRGGDFRDAHQVPTGNYPDGLVVADFDRDGRLDFALAATNSNMLNVHLNRTPVARHFWDSLR